MHKKNKSQTKVSTFFKNFCFLFCQSRQTCLATPVFSNFVVCGNNSSISYILCRKREKKNANCRQSSNQSRPTCICCL